MPKNKTTDKSAKVANKHVGEAAFKVAGEVYIARFGTKELAELETTFNVEGLGQIWFKANSTTHDNWVTFAKIGLSRYQPDLTREEVMELLDYAEGENEEGEIEGNIRPCHQAIVKAIAWSLPKQDPKEKPETTKATTESEISA